MIIAAITRRRKTELGCEFTTNLATFSWHGLS
jgi:hypothetical protein